MKQGVYIIRNTANGKFYIGSSIEIETRWSFHIWKLNKGTHHNARLQNAWNKYGQGFFEFHILEECDAKDTLVREQHYLDVLQPYNPLTGYNLSKITEGSTGNSKKVLQYDKRGEFIQAFDTLKEGAAFIGVNPQSISDVVCGRQASCLGYIWKIQENEDIPQKIETPYKLSSTGNVLPLGKCELGQYSMDGMFIRSFDTINDAAKLLGCSISSITQCVSGKRPSGAGYIWYYNDGGIMPENIDGPFVMKNGRWVSRKQNQSKLKPIIQYHLDGRFIKEYSGVATAVQETGLSRGLIRNALKNHNHKASGYLWQYKTD